MGGSEFEMVDGGRHLTAAEALAQITLAEENQRLRELIRRHLGAWKKADTDDLPSLLAWFESIQALVEAGGDAGASLLAHAKIEDVKDVLNRGTEALARGGAGHD